MTAVSAFCASVIAALNVTYHEECHQPELLCLLIGICWFSIFMNAVLFLLVWSVSDLSGVVMLFSGLVFKQSSLFECSTTTSVFIPLFFELLKDFSLRFLQFGYFVEFSTSQS